MPFRELAFSASRTGGGIRCRLSYHNRALLSLEGAVGAIPASIAGNVVAVRPLRRRAAIVWPSTIVAAWIADDASGGGAALRRVSGARWRLSPEFPALLEYRGFCAIAAHCDDGSLLIAAAGSPAAALALDPSVAAALPADALSALRRSAAPLRLALAESAMSGAATPGGAAALRFLRGCAGAECVAGRGEFGDAFVWTFHEPAGAVSGVGKFAMAGVAVDGTTLTLRFPFLPASARFRARWEDDAQDYYVRDGLEIRPAEVRADTKAVVKTLPGGGFLLRLG